VVWTLADNVTFLYVFLLHKERRMHGKAAKKFSADLSAIMRQWINPSIFMYREAVARAHDLSRLGSISARRAILKRAVINDNDETRRGYLARALGKRCLNKTSASTGSPDASPG